MADIIKPDLCIIGAGALGISLAITAREQGADVLLVDRGPEPGDTDGHRLQRLTVLASAARAQALRQASRVGIEGAEPRPNFKTIAEHAASVAEAAKPRSAPERLVALGIRQLSGTAAFVDRNTLQVGETSVRAAHFIVAIGDRPMQLQLPGLDSVPFFTPETIGDNLRKLSHLVVIGGGADALELAQAYARLGSAVTVVPQGDILPQFDREAVAVLLQALRAEGVILHEASQVTAVQSRSQGTGIAIRHADGSDDALDVSHILLAAGRLPDHALLLDKARLKPDPAQAGMVLPSSRISLVGASAGHQDPAIATAHAQATLARLLGRPGSFDPRHVVRVVQTMPALAQVGSLETGDRLPGGVSVLRASLGETEAARAQGETSGMLKLLLAGNGVVLGGAMTGAGAVETMALIALAIARAMPIADLAQLPLPATSPAWPLIELARQQAARTAPSRWHKPVSALRRLLP